MELETTREVEAIERLTRATDAGEIALAAYDGLIGLLEQLDPADWHAPTMCPGWDVAAMVGHLIGAAKACASMRESVRQQRWGRRHADAHGGNSLDALNELQVKEHAGLSPEARVAELRALAPAAVRGRMRVPRLLRAITFPLDAGGSTAAGMPSRLSVGHLMDVVYTRDTWLHTVDIAMAVGRSYEGRSDVDRRVIEDVVAEWAGRHGAPFELMLTGPAGGRFRRVQRGERGVRLELDAIRFCLVLSGRAAGDSVTDPASARLLDSKVLF